MSLLGDSLFPFAEEVEHYTDGTDIVARRVGLHNDGVVFSVCPGSISLRIIFLASFPSLFFF